MVPITVAGVDRFGAGADACVVTVIVDGLLGSATLGSAGAGVAQAGAAIIAVVGNGAGGAVTVGVMAGRIAAACGATIAGHNICFKLLPPVLPGDFFFDLLHAKPTQGTCSLKHFQQKLRDFRAREYALKTIPSRKSPSQ
jgi:hypothetical protein